MRNFLVRWIFASFGIGLASYIVKGIEINSLSTVFIAALVLGLLNATIKPVLILLTLPVNVVSLGLFTLVINAILLLLTAYIIKGFVISGFFPALFGSMLISFVNIIGMLLSGEKN